VYFIFSQFVLFLGVTILLASTYVTLNTQVTQIKEADSVIKVAQAENNPALAVDDKAVENLHAADDAAKPADPDSGELFYWIELEYSSTTFMHSGVKFN
jgi:hypothetical protein